MSGQILSVNVSLAREIGVDGRGVMSGIGKRSVEGSVGVRMLGLEGDEQADLSVHGGLSKAVYAYPSEHYAFWQTVRAQARVSAWEAPLPQRLPGREPDTLPACSNRRPGLATCCVSPTAISAISEPRFPCFKFNAVMGFNQAAKLMSKNGWCGFYLAVRKPGTLRAGERFTLVPGPREVGIAELFRSRISRAKL